MSTSSKEYLDRNAKGYEGDEFIHAELKKLVDKFGIDYIIETGTFLGGTTKRLAELSDVMTIEVVNDNYIKAKQNFESVKNILALWGDSVEVLKSNLQCFSNRSILFFLDSHWFENLPLLDELKEISNAGVKPVIAIHDWKVPNRPDLGYDSYKGQDFTFDWIKESIEKIYGVDGYSYHYNDQAEGAKRGVIYLYPKDAA